MTPPEPHGTLFPLVDLKAQFALIREEVMAAVARVFESQQFILGPEVEAFEKEIAVLTGAREAVGCGSGTAALELALRALEIKPGEEVITTPYTFVATAGAIAILCAKPVFVDIDPQTFNINATQIEAAITPKTRVIIPVHLFGLPADMQPILEIAQKHDLAVIEDAAQAIGACDHDQPVGSLGTLGCFSFFPSKNLGGAGDGGIVTTNDAALADRLRLLRAHGSRRKYHYEILGTNSRLDALQAAVLRVKLSHLASWTRARQQAASRYQGLFKSRRLDEIIRLPGVPGDRTHVFNQFVIRCLRRDCLREHLASHGIPTEIYYPLPIHLQPAFANLGYGEGRFPCAEAASRESLALPIYPEIEPSHQSRLVEAVAQFL